MTHQLFHSLKGRWVMGESSRGGLRMACGGWAGILLTHVFAAAPSLGEGFCVLFQGEVSHVENKILSTRVYSSWMKHVTNLEITRSHHPELRILEPCWPLVYLFDNIKKSNPQHHPEGNHSWCKCFSLQKQLWISEHRNPGKGQRHFIWQLNIIYNFYR